MSKSKNTRGKKEEEICKVAKVSNFVTDIRGFAKFLEDQNIGFKFEDEFDKQIPLREICKKINDFLDEQTEPAAFEKTGAGAPYYLDGDKKSVVKIFWKYLKEPTVQYTLKEAEIDTLGDITKDEDGDELISVHWSGLTKSTLEPVKDVIATLTEDGKNDLLKEIEKKRLANKPEQPKKSILKKPSGSAMEEKPKKHQTFGKRVYKPIPATYARDALPTDAQLLTAGETLKALEKNKNVKVSSDILSDWWIESVGDELNHFYVVDNEGCGDCMYLAMAPMLRVLKPELFQGVAETPPEDAIRLRQLLAALLPETQQGLTDYFNSYKDNFTSEVLATNYNREYAQKKDEATADYRKRLQEQMMQPEHYAHLPDFGLLGKLIGSSVAIILIGGEYNGPNANTNRVKGRREVEKFVIYPAVVVPAQLDDQNTRYVFVVHRNEHFTRLRKENGQFAFSQQQLSKEFPTIWGIFERIVKPDDYSRQLVELKDAILARYNELEPLARRDNQDRSYEVVVNGLLEMDKKKLNDKDRERLKTFSQSKNTNERNRIVDELVSETESNDAAILTQNAKEKVAKFISEYNPNTIVEPLKQPVKATRSKKIGKPICTPLNKEEEEKLANIKKAAKEAKKGFVLKSWDGENITKNEIDRLTLYDALGRKDEEKYINDQTINAYARKTLEEIRLNPLPYYKVGFLSTAFYEVQGRRKDDESLAKFNAVGPLEDIFQLEKLFIPVNVNKNHWILAVVNFANKKIEFYDSLCKVDTEPVFKVIKTYLRVKANALKRENIQWVKVENQKDDLPQQDNVIDCGVFVMAYIRELVRRDFEKFEFSQKDIICLRKRIMLELLPDFKTPVATTQQVGKQPLDLQISPSQSFSQSSQQKEEDKVVVQTSKRRRQTSPPVTQDSPPRVETIEQVISDDEEPIPESEWGKYID